MDDTWIQNCRYNYKIANSYPTTSVILAHQWGVRPLICNSAECENDINIKDVNYYRIINDELGLLVGIFGDGSIYIIGQAPAPKVSIIQCMKRYDHKNCVISTTEFSGERIRTNLILKEFSEAYDNVYFINPFSSICSADNTCVTISDNKNRFLI